jgi:hypothetical protein
MTRIGLQAAMVLAVSWLPALAQPEAAKDKARKDIRTLNESLRGVINTGAALFNDNGDYVGCYRLFQGALLTSKPFLAEKSQKDVDDSLAKAEKMGAYDDKAFELRRALDLVRVQLKAQEDALGNVEFVPPPKQVPKVSEPTPKIVDPKPMDPKSADPKPMSPSKPAVIGNVKGKVTFEGAPLPAGATTIDYKDQPRPAAYLLLVTEEGRKVSTAIHLDGSFAFKSVLGPGVYRVAIENAPEQTIPVKEDIPNRYRRIEDSGLTVQIVPGNQFLEIRLVK